MNPHDATSSDEKNYRLAEFWLAYEAAPDAVAKQVAHDDFCARNPDLKDEVAAQLGLRRRIEPESVPERIERFPVRRVIDRGGMGRVFEAEQEPLGRLVAVKTIRGDRNDLLHRVRFHNERLTLAHLHHTHIVPIYAAGREGQLDYYAMPLIQGASLRRALDEARRLAAPGRAVSLPGLIELVHLACARGVDPADGGNEARAWNPSPEYLRSVVGVMVDAADALEHAHRQGYLHRDVKPSNIMVDLRGHCWVVDFGLAPIRDPLPWAEAGPGANGHAGSSNPGTLVDHGATTAPHPEAEQYRAAVETGTVGTPAYMAPEQRHGKADARSDVWGLGVTFYELLTGRQARPDLGSASEPPAPRTVVPGLPRDLDAICRKATRPDPSQRYATAGDFRDDLQSWLDHRPIRARPMWPLHRAWLWARRNKGWAAAMLVAVAALTSAGVIRGNLRAAVADANAKVARAAAVAADERAAAARAVADAAEARALDLKRENLIQQVERLRLSSHRAGWSADAWGLVRQAAAIRVDDALQISAAGCLAGYDARVVQEFKDVGAAALAFDRDGRRLLMGAVTDPKRVFDHRKHQPLATRLWDASTRTMTVFAAAALGPIAFRGDGTPVQLIPGTEKDGPAAILLDLPRNEPLCRFSSPAGAAFDAIKGELALSPDSSVVAAVLQRPGKGQLLVAWDGGTGRRLESLDLDTSVHYWLAVSPDGSLVAAGAETGRIVVWSPATGRTVATVENGRSRLNCLSFGRDLRRPEPTGPGPDVPHWLLAAGDSGGTVTVWDLTRQEVVSYCPGSNYDVYAIAFSPDGATMASCGRTDVKLWDIRNGGRILDMTAGLHGYLLSLAFTPDGRRLALGSWAMFGPGGVEVWEFENGRGIETVYGLRGQIDWTCFSPDGRRLAGLSHKFEVGIWDRETGRLLRLLDTPLGLFADNAGLAFSADGRRFAMASGERATLWDVDTGAVLGSWKLPVGLCDRLGFEGPDRLRLLRNETKSGRVPPTTGYDPKDHPRVLRIRRLAVPDRVEIIREVDDFNLGVFHAEVAPDGSIFVAEGFGAPGGGKVARALKAFDGATGRELWSVPVSSTRDGASFQVDPSGHILWHEDVVSGEKQLSFPLMELRTARPLGHITSWPFALGVGAVRWFSRLSDFGGSLALIEQGQDRPRLRIPDPEASGHTVFGPDGIHAALGHPDGTVTVPDLVEIPRRLSEFRLGW